MTKLTGRGDYGCAGGHCPAVYQTTQGSYIVQGKILSSNAVGALALGPDESAVEVPADVIQELLSYLTNATN